jgi:hypothetical protein
MSANKDSPVKNPFKDHENNSNDAGFEFKSDDKSQASQQNSLPSKPEDKAAQAKPE